MNKIYLLLLVLLITSCSRKIAEFGAISTREIKSLQNNDYQSAELKKCRNTFYVNPLFYAGDAKIPNLINNILETSDVLLNISTERTYFDLLIYGRICRSITANAINTKND